MYSRPHLHVVAANHESSSQFLVATKTRTTIANLHILASNDLLRQLSKYHHTGAQRLTRYLARSFHGQASIVQKSKHVLT
jgi:hypothetical protein